MTESIFFASVIVALIVGVILNRLFSKTSGDSKLLTEEIDSLKRTLEERSHRIESQNQEISRLVAERDVERERVDNLRQQLEKSAEQLTQSKDEAQQHLEERLAELRGFYEQQLKLIEKRYEELMAELRETNRAQVESQLKLIQEQMQTTSERVLKTRQQELESRNAESVSRMVDPLRDSLKRMTDALDNSKREHQESMTRLDATIQENLRNSRELGLTAERLANALTGEVKVQGNFGEMCLRKLLDDLGLKEHTHYTTQSALRDKFGKKIKSDDDKGLIPDFILHFPNNRDVIVDSKVVITDYERYMNATDQEEKSRYLASHIKALRSQVDLLANKDYGLYLDSNYAKLNFVIMYVFHESALNLALMNDTGLWNYAYKKKVLIMGPQTMHMNLRVLELMWGQMTQLAKQQEIIAQAELIIERTQLFAARLVATEKHMKEVLKDFIALKVSTGEKGKSIITPAKRLIALGAQQNSSKNKVDLTQIFVEDDDELLLDIDMAESDGDEAYGGDLGAAASESVEDEPISADASADEQ